MKHATTSVFSSLFWHLTPGLFKNQRREQCSEVVVFFISLQDNLLETLDDWVKSLSTSANVTLSGNPFKCSCDLINATAKLTSVDETGITCK